MIDPTFLLSLKIFAAGFFGSIAVDVTTAIRFYEAGNTVSFPERYSRKLYYFLRLILAVMAGGLALSYDIQQVLLAVNIGASTPLIIQTLSSGLVKIGTSDGAIETPKSRRTTKQKSSPSEAV